MPRGVYAKTREIKKKSSDSHKDQKAWNKGLKTDPLSEEHKRKIRKFSNEKEIKIEKQYREEKVSFVTLGKRYNCSAITIRNIVIRQNGLIRSKKEGVNTESCKRLLKLNNPAVKGKLVKEKNGMFGKVSANWQGGKYKTEEGYILVYRPEHPYCNINGYVLEHRLIMEKYLGRYLTKEEVVHYKNGIKNDNRIKNLQLFKNKSEHSSFLIENTKGSFKDTKPELKMEEILNFLHIPYEKQFRIDNHLYDGHILNSPYLIEVDGDYYHGNPKKFSKLNKYQLEQKQRDLKNNKLAKEKGYIVLRFWENDILNNSDDVKNEIKKLKEI